MSSNIELIKKLMGYSSDIFVREFTITPDSEIKAAVILIKGMVEKELINEQVIGALMLNDRLNNIKNSIKFFKIIKEYGIPNVYVSEESDINKIINELSSGNTILFLDEIDRVLIIGSQGWKDRAQRTP